MMTLLCAAPRINQNGCYAGDGGGGGGIRNSVLVVVVIWRRNEFSR